MQNILSVKPKNQIIFVNHELMNCIFIFHILALGKPVDATQELLAVGLCNIGNSFFHSFPGTGSFSRSAVNAASGVRTPMGGLYSGEIYFFQKSIV